MSYVAHVAAAVEDHFRQEGTGHDWQHIYRVWQTAIKLGGEEGANMDIVNLAALLHEADDYKLVGAEGEKTLPNARKFMADANVPQPVAEDVCTVIRSIGYRKTLAGDVTRSLEGNVVSDADMLDAIGAVGIARTFTYCGGKGFGMFLPDALPQEKTKDSYMQGGAPSVTHFFEKLLKLRTLMQTASGKTEADIRHQRMVAFLDNFFTEANAPQVWKDLLQPYS
ncbi:MAG: HD domain-containing protein [Alphaproteobacteria bacterium]|nr:MAG: HD domain-containing protein [Alphaproteobacteria bacterium]